MTAPFTNTNGYPTPPPPGIYVPTVTFFEDDDSLDTETTAKHAVRMAEGGMSGLVVQGTNGESVHLDDEGQSSSRRFVGKPTLIDN
jgi:dihydrodipicolinate synthase/N-acetylneuraminate lyase